MGDDTCWWEGYEKQKGFTRPQTEAERLRGALKKILFLLEQMPDGTWLEETLSFIEEAAKEALKED